MKNILTIFGITSIILAESLAIAVTIGGTEPPLKYMNSLKTCTPGTFKTTENSYVNQYVIKGKLSDGRCMVTTTSYTDYSNPQTYKDAIHMMKSFAEGIGGKKIPDSQIPTQAQMIERSKKEATVEICKFTTAQRQELYKAYLKHDGKHNQGNVKRDKDGNITSFSGSFSTSNMSSYERLMMNYSAGTCVQK